MEIKEYPPDNPNAIDRLRRFSYERCLVDSEYASQHADWFKWAHGERARREAEKRDREHREEVNAARLADLVRRETESREEHEQRAESKVKKITDATALFQRHARRY